MYKIIKSDNKDIYKYNRFLPQINTVPFDSIFIKYLKRKYWKEKNIFKPKNVVVMMLKNNKWHFNIIYTLENKTVILNCNTNS